MGLRHQCLVCAGVFSLAASASMAAPIVLHFNDQAPVTNDDQIFSEGMSRDGLTPGNIYDDADFTALGIPVQGLRVEFTGFGRNPDGYIGVDASGGVDPTGKKLIGYEPTATIVFNQPVHINNFLVYNRDGNWDGYMFSVMGTGPSESFPSTFEATSADPNGDDRFWEVSHGNGFLFADYAITKLEFTNFDYVLFDELSFTVVPEPSAAMLIVGLAGVCALRRRVARNGG